jgi:hypothetical protein
LDEGFALTAGPLPRKCCSTVKYAQRLIQLLAGVSAAALELAGTGAISVFGIVTNHDALKLTLSLMPWLMATLDTAASVAGILGRLGP